MSFKITQRMISACEYKDFIAPDEWALKYYHFDKTSAVGVGKFNFKHAPHQKLPLNYIGKNEVREITLWVASQTGKTTIAMIALNWYMDNRGGNAMFFLPSDELVNSTATNRILPAIAKTPNAQSLVAEKKERGLRENTKDIRYLGGSVRVLSSTKSANRKSTPAAFIIMDEISEMKHEHVMEISERAKTYEQYGAKIIKTSTAMHDDDPVVFAYEASEVKFEYSLKCPYCLKNHIDNFLENIRYPSIDEFDLENEKTPRLRLATYAQLASKSAKYECPHCKKLWDDADKDKAIDAGEWVRTSAVDIGRSVGFKASSFISKFVSIAELTRQFLLCDNDEQKAAFYRGWLNQIYTPEIKTTPLSELEKLINEKLKQNEIPDDTVGLFGAIDVQKDHYYYLVMAVDSKLNRHIVDCGRFNSDVELINFVASVGFFRKSDNGKKEPVFIECFAIDSGFKTDEIYQLCYNLNHFFNDYSPQKERILANRQGELITAIPIKGASTNNSNTTGDLGRIVSIDKDINGKAFDGGLNLHVINTYLCKDTLMTHLDNQINDKDAERLQVYHEAPESLLKSLVSEHKVQVKSTSGKVIFAYEPVTAHPFNHYLDCATYCYYLIARFNVRFRASAYAISMSNSSISNKDKTSKTRDYLDEF